MCPYRLAIEGPGMWWSLLFKSQTVVKHKRIFCRSICFFSRTFQFFKNLKAKQLPWTKKNKTLNHFGMYINKKQRTICNICSYNLANCCTCRNIAFIKNLMTYALKLKVPDMICVLHLGNWGPKKKMICFFVKFRHPFLFEEAGLMSLVFKL